VVSIDVPIIWSSRAAVCRSISHDQRPQIPASTGQSVSIQAWQA
jgi:hypothetical protein